MDVRVEVCMSKTMRMPIKVGVRTFTTRMQIVEPSLSPHKKCNESKKVNNKPYYIFHSMSICQSKQISRLTTPASQNCGCSKAGYFGPKTTFSNF